MRGAKHGGILVNTLLQESSKDGKEEGGSESWRPHRSCISGENHPWGADQASPSPLLHCSPRRFPLYSVSFFQMRTDKEGLCWDPRLTLPP